MEEQAVEVAAEGAGAAVNTAPLVLEQNFFLSLIDTMTPGTYVLTYIMVVLFLLQGIFLGLFLLNAFFDTSLTTVAERHRSLWRALGGILALQFVIALIFALLLYRNSGAA